MTLLAAINLSMWRCPKAKGPNPKSNIQGRHALGSERNGLAKPKYGAPRQECRRLRGAGIHVSKIATLKLCALGIRE